jgi:ABC-type nickel/cobalt efflux system permease component RcnA
MNEKNGHRRHALQAATLIITGLAICAVYLLLRRHGIGVSDLLVTDGNPHSVTVVSILAYSLVFGLKHALEPDHLAAVSTIAVEHKSLFGSSLVGAVWGLGHTLSLLLAGLVVILLGFDLREEYLEPVEVIVALMLIGLGARALWKLWRERSASVSDGQPEKHNHSHVHHDHSHGVWGRIGVRPLLIGMVHGLAGSAALLLLLIPVIPSTALKIVYILVFGAGSIVGMVIMSCMVGLPTHLMAERFLKVSLAVRALAGLFSLGFGIWLLQKLIQAG